MRWLAALLCTLPLVAWTPSAKADSLHDAAQDGDLARVEALLAQGNSPDATGGDGNTALYIAAYRGNAEVVEALLAGGADPTRAGRKEVSPLHVAIGRGHVEIAERLI